MAEETWFVAMDGQQLEGARSTEEVRELMRGKGGKKMVVWNEKLTGWTDPATLPQFRAAEPAPSPVAAATPASAPPPRPASVPGATAGAVAAAVAASGPEAKAALKEDAKFLRGLLDFGFTQLITPKIIRALYIITIVLIGLGLVAMIIAALGMIFMGARFGGGTAVLGVIYLVLAPILALVQVTFARMFFELVLVLFRIKDAIVHLEEHSRT